MKENKIDKTKEQQPDLGVVQEKGKKRSNPWQDSRELNSNDATVKQSSAQVVQNLPPCLANDLILKAILQPPSQQVKFGDLPNVIPLEVNYGGTQENPKSSSNIVQQKAHKDKVVEYDKTKGFVTTSWANFLLEKGKDSSKPNSLTTNQDGIFIKHVTSAVINPNDLFKNQQGQSQGKQSSVHVTSSSFSSANLLSNTWSNVLLYTPDEQTYELNEATGTYELKKPKWSTTGQDGI